MCSMGWYLHIMVFVCCKVLRVSMEEQRQRQEDEARRAMQQDGGQTRAGTYVCVFVCVLLTCA